MAESFMDIIRRNVSNGALRKNPDPPRDYGDHNGTEQCVRVYRSGDIKTTHWTAANAADWLAYNTFWRFGNALFINGECKNLGYMTEEECAEISAIIREYNNGGTIKS